MNGWKADSLVNVKEPVHRSRSGPPDGHCESERSKERCHEAESLRGIAVFLPETPVNENCEHWRKNYKCGDQPHSEARHVIPSERRSSGIWHCRTLAALRMSAKIRKRTLAARPWQAGVKRGRTSCGTERGVMVRSPGRLSLVLLAAMTAFHSPPAQPVTAAHVRISDEQALRQTDMEQARLVQDGDAAGLMDLFHPSYTVHAANGRVYGLEQTLILVRNGSLARERFLRTQESVTISGSTGVVVGVDRLEAAPPLARNGERTRRYTNVYVVYEGRWRLLARHFHLLP